MDKKMIRLVITLTVIGIISALLLSAVYEWTSPHIERHQREQKERAILEVIPEAVEYQEKEINDKIFYEGFDDTGRFVGVAREKAGRGFQDRINVLIGADPHTEKIYGIMILQHQETPGLGARITEDNFKSYFEDKPFGEYELVQPGVEAGDYQVETISGATMTSEYIIEIVENAVKEIQDAYRSDS